jgi:hypothetical protein
MTTLHHTFLRRVSKKTPAVTSFLLTMPAAPPCPVTQVDVDAIIKDVDLDHDGRINYDEFCSCMHAKEQVRLRGHRTV